MLPTGASVYISHIILVVMVSLVGLFLFQYLQFTRLIHRGGCETGMARSGDTTRLGIVQLSFGASARLVSKAGRRGVN